MDKFAPDGALARGMIPDDALGRLFARNAPHVDDDEIWRRIESRVRGGAPRRSGRLRAQRVRRVGLAFTAVALVAAVAVGVYTAATRLGNDDFIVVIDDDPMRPGATAASPTTTAAATATTTAGVDTTAAGVDTTAAGGFYEPEPFELDLGPVDKFNLVEAWTAIAGRAGLDARTARAYRFALDFSAQGGLLGMSMLMSVSQTRVLAVECKVVDGKEGQSVVATATATDVPSYGPAVADDRLYEVLKAIDQVGAEQIIAKLPRAGAGGYYQLGTWPPDTELPADQDGYMWDGAQFVPVMSSGGLVRPDPAQWVWIPATAMAFGDAAGTTPTTSYTASLPVHFFIGISQPSTVTAQAAPTGAGLTDPEFAPLVEAWGAVNVAPLSVGHDASEDDAIFVKLADADLAPPDGVFTSVRLTRQAFLATREQRLPFNMMSVYRVTSDGAETLDYAISLQSGMHIQDDWTDARDIGPVAAGEKVGQAMRDIGQGSVLVSSLLDARYEGRVLEVAATLSTSKDNHYEEFLGRLISTVQQLNEGGCHIVMLELRVNDYRGEPVLRDVHDYQLGSVTTWYDGADYLPPWIDPPPTTSPAR